MYIRIQNLLEILEKNNFACLFYNVMGISLEITKTFEKQKMKISKIFQECACFPRAFFVSAQAQKIVAKKFFK